jgi:hypothetical protein
MRTSDEQIYGGTVTENGDSYAAPINVKGAGEVVLFLDVTVASGTNPTLIVKLMTQDTISTKWFEIGKFDTVSSVTTDTTPIINGLGSFLGCVWEVGGTDNPSFTFALNASIKD